MVAIGLVVLLGTYINFSSPGRVVVRDTGEVVGILNKLRKEFQGTQFWRDQLQEVNRALASEFAGREREAALQRKLSELDDELKRDEEQMYREHPELRPMAEKQEAEALRNRANALEMASLFRMLEQFRIERIAELRRIKRQVEVLAE